MTMGCALLILILWPLVGGIALFALRGRDRLAQGLNVAISLVWLGAFLCAWKQLSVGSAFPVALSWNWLPILKSNFSLGLDGLNAPLVGLNVVLALCLAFYALGNGSLNATYLGTFSVLNAASVGSLLAADALAFYFFWEFMLIPMFFLIGQWGGKNRVYAALKFFAMTMGGSLLLLLAILALAYKFAVPSLGWHDIAAQKFAFDGWMSPQGLLFLGFLAAFAVKIPLWPLHTWLPDAHTEAPTGGSVILAGVLLKLGVYGIARWCLPLFPEASAAAAPCLSALACAGIVLGALAAWRQTDVKRLIAYSSVSHLGFMVLGLFALRAEGLQGALFQNIAHGLSTGALFLIFGMIYDRTHTRDLSDYGGLASRSGLLATAFVFSAMASIGLPGLPGFVGEFLILNGVYGKLMWAALIASLGILLGAVYMLSLLRKTVFGPVSVTINDHPVNLKWNEWVALAPLLVGMLILGMAPQLLIAPAAEAVNFVLQGVR